MAAIGQTVSGISHCVKNMLTGLKGGLSLAEMGAQQQNPEIVGQGLGMLSRAVNRVSLLVLDMLDYSKERKPMRRPCDVGTLMEDARGAVAYDAQRRGVAVEIDAPPTRRPVHIDGDQVFRCLLNLVTNAMDAVDEGDGRVTMRARILPPGHEDLSAEGLEGKRDGEGEEEGSFGAVVFEVSDNGCGIETEKLDEIFEPFFSTKGSKGTGIGLAVTRKITAEHGGRVEVESERGKGTTFRLLIPCPFPQA